MESPWTAVIEVAKAASANDMNRNTGAKMQMANRSLLISHHLNPKMKFIEIGILFPNFYRVSCMEGKIGVNALYVIHFTYGNFECPQDESSRFPPLGSLSSLLWPAIRRPHPTEY